MSGKEKNCKLVWRGRKTKKLTCKTHRQPLMYVYMVGDAVGFRCQVGEEKHLTLQGFRETITIGDNFWKEWTEFVKEQTGLLNDETVGEETEKALRKYMKEARSV